MALFDELKKNAQGLVPAIVQDDETGEVLMMAYVNGQALEKTLQTGTTHFYSRSRDQLWHKGESSGHTQEVRSVYLDCDSDTLLIRVKQNVAACHTGYRSCFFRRLTPRGDRWAVVGERVFDPEETYGNKE